MELLWIEFDEEDVKVQNVLNISLQENGGINDCRVICAPMK